MAGFASGKYARGFCQRCGLPCLYSDLQEDGDIPKLRVCSDCWEPKHPQESPAKIIDPEALRHPAPEQISYTYDADAGTIQFGAATLSGDGSVSISVTRVGGSFGQVTAEYLIAGEAATQILEWEDGDAANKFIVLPPEMVQRSVELIEVVTISKTGQTIQVPWGGAEIVDVALPGILRFSAPTYAFVDTEGTVSVYAERIGGADGAASASVVVTGGTAVPGVDFNLLTTSIAWASGDASDKPIQVQLFDT